MRNKGAVKLLAIALAIVVIYQLSFTFITLKVNKDAKEFANGDVEKELYYKDSLSSVVVYNLGFREYTYKECREREINLGLDLKGGMNVMLEVSVEDIIRSLSNNSKDSTFNAALALAKQNMEDSQEDFITLFGEAFTTIDPNAQLAAVFNTMELRDHGISFSSTNEEVLRVIRRESQDAVDNSFNVLRSRIDRFGVAQANIQQLERTGRILIELPGVKEPERVKKLLEGTAQLEFWETYENNEIYPYLLEANAVIKEMNAAAEAIKEEAKEEDAAPAEQAEATEETQEELDLLSQLESDTTATQDSTAMQEEMMKDYPLFAVMQPSVGRDNSIMPGSVIGMVHVKDTAKVNKYLHNKKVRSVFPRDLIFMWHVKPPKWDDSESFYELHAIKVTSRDGQAPLDGSVVTNAREEFGQNQAEAEVTMSMNAEGAKTWARLTKDNVGRSIAIVLDGFVYSAPRVNGEIKGGSSSITGDFTINEAKDLANVLKSGKLEAQAYIIQEEIVGPSLGQEAINAGFKSFIIAFAVVLLYMLFYYSTRGGLVADMALIINMIFMMGVLASFGATLTLPGIAGIVLTIGMSVDANVLIYERIREELAAGKGSRLALSDGYKNAFSAIIDANVTTFLTALILYVFGTGPIKGFATTLLIGIATSLFAAIFLTRLVYEWMLDRNMKITFDTSITRNAFKNANIQFIAKRKIFYIISGLIVVLGIASLATRGLNPGVDFAGGRSFVVRFEQPVNTVEIQGMLAEVYGSAPEVKTFGEDDQIKVTTKYRINEDGAEVDEDVENKLYEGLKPLLGEGVSLEQFLSDYRKSSVKVGPTIADDIKRQAVIAIFFSLLVIFVYILIRFKNWQYGLGAVAALMHDTLIVLGIFSIFYGRLPFSLEIDQAFIAAILTVVGYSINDTVVVFDRIREFFGLYPKREREDIMNKAINSTLSRTFSTSLSTFVVLLTIFIFGGEVIRGFIFALMVGVVVGTYSSLFIATPVVFDTVNSKKAKKGLKN